MLAITKSGTVAHHGYCIHLGGGWGGGEQGVRGRRKRVMVRVRGAQRTSDTSSRVS